MKEVSLPTLGTSSELAPVGREVIHPLPRL